MHKCKQAIILAAGQGFRLNVETPKSLHIFNNKTLLENNLDQLVKFGFEEIFVVCGYKKELFTPILKKYKNVLMIENIEYLKTGTTHTISKAMPYIKECFVLIEADFLCEDRGIQELFNNSGNSFITTSYSGYGDEAVAVFKNGKFVDVSKNPKYREGNQQVPEYCGPSHLTKNMAELMIEYDLKNGCSLNYYSTMAPVIQDNNISISMIYIPHFKWADLDFKEDFEKIKRML